MADEDITLNEDQLLESLEETNGEQETEIVTETEVSVRSQTKPVSISPWMQKHTEIREKAFFYAQSSRHKAAAIFEASSLNHNSSRLKQRILGIALHNLIIINK